MEGYAREAERMVLEGATPRQVDVDIGVDGQRHRIDFGLLTGKNMTVYGQTEVTRDLMDARAACGAVTIYDAGSVALHHIAGSKPKVTFRRHGVAQELECDSIKPGEVQGSLWGVSRRTRKQQGPNPSSALCLFCPLFCPAFSAFSASHILEALSVGTVGCYCPLPKRWHSPVLRYA